MDKLTIVFRILNENYKADNAVSKEIIIYYENMKIYKNKHFLVNSSLYRLLNQGNMIKEYDMKYEKK